MQMRMDAAGAVDGQNAPTAPWNTAQNAVSHSAHTHHHFRRTTQNERRQPALHTKFRTLPVWINSSANDQRPTTNDYVNP
jgi:hypothetical protein